MSTINYNEVPHGYAHCFADCEKAGTCLRAIAAASVPDTIKEVMTLIPRHLKIQEGKCEFYRSNTKVIFARGFIKFLDSLPYGTMRSVIFDLQRNYSSQRQYFRARKGEVLISPRQQEMIRKVVARHGITTPVEYDSYVEKYDW